MYFIKFSDQEKIKFNLIDNEAVRASSMSIYGYMLKLTHKRNKNFAEANLLHLVPDQNKLEISFREFLEKYNTKYHNNVSIRTLKKRIDLLKELGLIVVNKVKNSFTYNFFRYLVNETVNEQVNIFEEPKALESTSIEDDSTESKYLNIKTNTIDLDSNSKSTLGGVISNIDKDQYIENLEKNCSWDEVCNMMTDAFNLLKVKSDWIKSRVIEKICKYHANITKKHAMSYIYTCIADAKNIYYANYNKHVKNEYYTKPSTFCDYPQRTYDFNELEPKLLGWSS